MRIKLNLSKGFYLTYPDGAIAYPQNFETQALAEQKRDKLGFSDWKVKEVSQIAREFKPKFSRREEQVILLLFDGYTNADIAQEMDISIGTVKYYLQQIRMKLRIDPGIFDTRVRIVWLLRGRYAQMHVEGYVSIVTLCSVLYLIGDWKLVKWKFNKLWREYEIRHNMNGHTKAEAGDQMAQFEPAFTNTLQHEDATLSGSVTKDPTAKDPFALVRFGINSAAHPEALTAGFYSMDHDRALEYAADIYKYSYFAPIGGYQIRDQDIANKYFDLAVNSGIGEATKIIQRACNRIIGPLELGLQVDGKPGQKTLDSINTKEPGELLSMIKSYAAEFYQDWARAQNISQDLLNALIVRANS